MRFITGKFKQATPLPKQAELLEQFKHWQAVNEDRVSNVICLPVFYLEIREGACLEILFSALANIPEIECFSLADKTTKTNDKRLQPRILNFV